MVSEAAKNWFDDNASCLAAALAYYTLLIGNFGLDQRAFLLLCDGAGSGVFAPCLVSC